MLGNSLAVAVGGALGSLARFCLAELFVAWGMVAFPWATLVANVSGSFLIGVIAALTGPDGRLLVAPELRLFWMVGICGGYTTFSSFSLQTLTMAQGGDWVAPALNVLLSLVLCLLAVWLGYLAAGVARPVRGSMIMELPQDATLLRIFLGEHDRHAGPAALRGDRAARRASSIWPVRRSCAARWAMGANSRIHRANLLEISEDLPMVIEIVDSVAKVDSFLPVLEAMMGSGLVTLEQVKVLRYGDGPSAG